MRSERHDGNVVKISFLQKNDEKIGKIMKKLKMSIFLSKKMTLKRAKNESTFLEHEKKYYFQSLQLIFF